MDKEREGWGMLCRFVVGMGGVYPTSLGRLLCISAIACRCCCLLMMIYGAFSFLFP